MLAPLSAFGLAYAGLVSLSLAMSRHHEQVLGQRGSAMRLRQLRIGGWLLIALSSWPCVAVWGWSIGLFGVWGGALSLAAFVYVFALPYAPKLTAGIALASPLAAVAWVLGL